MGARAGERPWTDAEIVSLRAKWGSGERTVKIGRDLNRSKCSIVGKAHRLGLPARPSPILPPSDDPRRDTREGRRPIPSVSGSTLPPLPSQRERAE